MNEKNRDWKVSSSNFTISMGIMTQGIEIGAASTLDSLILTTPQLLLCMTSNFQERDAEEDQRTDNRDGVLLSFEAMSGKENKIPVELANLKYLYFSDSSLWSCTTI